MDVYKEPQTKRRRSLDIAHCVICSDLLQGSNHGPAVKNPTVEGLRSVLNAAELSRTTFISRYGHIERTYSLCNSKCPTTKAVEHNTPARQMSAVRLRSQNPRRPVLLHPNQEDSPERILAASTSGNSASFADLPKNVSQTKAGKSSHQSVQALESPRDQK